ncbi:hypothetical protein ARTHRO9AX_10215 [Arthrobacter sp. 9AX]|nr:hypothetical protein ARTHRO9AX_10215 [Arthrobacter sp. 9AX]
MTPRGRAASCGRLFLPTTAAGAHTNGRDRWSSRMVSETCQSDHPGSPRLQGAGPECLPEPYPRQALALALTTGVSLCAAAQSGACGLVSLTLHLARRTAEPGTPECGRRRRAVSRETLLCLHRAYRFWRSTVVVFVATTESGRPTDWRALRSNASELRLTLRESSALHLSAARQA